MSRVRTGAYRESFFNSSELRPLLPQLWPAFESYKARWHEGLISAAELTGAVLLLIWQTARPKSWRNGRRDVGVEERLTSDSPLFPVQNVRFRGIPEAAQLILLDWHFGRVALDLYFRIPDSSEVLQAQCHGRRCVSLLIESEERFLAGGENRDSFSFALHDLLHAAQFYRSKEHFEKQVFFCRWMRRLSESPQLEKRLAEDSELRHSFDYLISDMNTHWVHSMKCLKSILPAHLHSTCLSALRDFRLAETKDFEGLWDQLNTPAETDAFRALVDDEFCAILPLTLKGLNQPRKFL